MEFHMYLLIFGEITTYSCQNNSNIGYPLPTYHGTYYYLFPIYLLQHWATLIYFSDNICYSSQQIKRYIDQLAMYTFNCNQMILGIIRKITLTWSELRMQKKVQTCLLNCKTSSYLSIFILYQSSSHQFLCSELGTL